MSGDSWKAEFYPSEAKDHPGDIRHSLRKWIGLRKENLERHGLVSEFLDASLQDEDNYEVIPVDDTTCSLCVKYLNWDCGACPVVAVTGSWCGARDSPYDIYATTGDPEPMIKVLRECLERRKVDANKAS